MTRQEDGPTPGGETADEVSGRCDAVRIQAVERLVQYEDRRVADQRRRECQPLPHAERVAADAAVGRVGQPDRVEHLLDPGPRNFGLVRDDAQVVAR